MCRNSTTCTEELASDAVADKLVRSEKGCRNLVPENEISLVSARLPLPILKN
jgi:hypothetical protein